MFRRTSRFALLFALLASSLASVAQSQQAAPAAPDMGQVYAQAMSEFAAGDYAKAAADLEALLAKVEVTPQIEPVFFTVGSAWFNAGDYTKAAAAFKRYQEKFPQGAHSGDAALGLAQASLGNKDYTNAATQFAALERDPRLREQAQLAQATALKEGGKPEQAIPVLEKLVGTEIKSAVGARGAMLLALSYVQAGQAEKAVRTIRQVHEKIGFVDNVVELNGLTVEQGDQLFAKKQYAQALDCYQVALPRDRIIKLQTERIAAMQRRIESNLAAVRENPAEITQLAAANNQLKASIATAQKLLEDFSKLPDITPALYVRMGRCFYEKEQKWEAAVVYTELLHRFPKAAEREPALFGLIAAFADVNQPTKALARCEEYLKEFKDGPNAETIGYMMGATALQANDPRTAETYFGRMLETQPKSTYREQMRFLFGNAKFMAGKYDEAKAEYEKYLKEFPKGQSYEDVTYRIALTALFAGKYEEAMKQLGSYLGKYPKGQYVSDAKYRLAVCKYAASLYDEVIKDCEAWEKEFAGNQQLGEVLALLADSYAASNREDQAVNVYARAYKLAATDEVMNYCLTNASKLLQKKGDWNRVAELYTEFIKEKPDNPTVITGLYWIGKAKAHEGKIDEAKQLTAETIKKYIGDPKRDAVEQLLTQLAQLCVRKKKADEPAPPGDPGAELDALLASAATDQSPLAKARVLFAKAELGRLRRQPAEEEKNIGAMAESSKPEDLSPMLLGRAGDYLLSKGKLDQAEGFYQRLMGDFPKSDNIDFAYNGLAEIAFSKKDYPKALRYFSDATEKIAAAQKLKDVTVGRGKTLLAMDKLDEAKKVFEQVASMREWRGEATAFSMYSLGEIEARRQRWAEANSYFQRVYVGYQKFLPWVAKAYISSAESFEKMGKTQEAVNTYKELLRNEKLAAFAEAEQARKRLQAMGQG